MFILLKILINEIKTTEKLIFLNGYSLKSLETRVELIY